MIQSVIIFLIAFLTYFLISKLLDFLGRKRLIELQMKVNEINKNYLAAIKEKNEEKIREYEEKMKETPKIMMEMLILNLKTTLGIIPFLIIVPYVIKILFPTFSITLPVYLPVIKFNNLSLEIRNTFGSYGWFFISFFLSGLIFYIFSKLKNLISQEKKEKK